MAETNETVTDIIAEKRRKADELEASSYRPHQFLRERIAELRQEADRLEAALKREKAAIEADALAVGGIVEASRNREVFTKTREIDNSGAAVYANDNKGDAK